MKRFVFFLGFGSFLGSCFAALGTTAARAQSVMPLAAVDSSIGHVDVTLDLPKDVPYVGEMILLRVRSTIRGFVTLDEIRQPPLTNFNWQQLGRDKPIHAMVDGFDVPGFERDIAIFPQQAGRLIIDPFVRHVTMVVGDNMRVETDFTSKPIFVDVQRHEGLGHAGEWWLPAKSVTIKETWSPPPDQIEPGKVSRRIVTIQAVGTTADQLPPPPSMRAPGVITFTGPAERRTVLTPDGPVAQATYQWDIRPVTASPAKLPAIHIPWFDISERRMRDTVIPDQWVSYAGSEIGGRQRPGSPHGGYWASGPLLAGCAGFLWAASLGVFAATARGKDFWSGLLKRSRFAPLSRAARRGDAAGVKAALMGLARGDAACWREVAVDPAVVSDLAWLDAALYARTPRDMPPLKPLVTTIRRRWRAIERRRAVSTETGLMAIDAPPIPQRAPRDGSRFWRRVR